MGTLEGLLAESPGLLFLVAGFFSALLMAVLFPSSGGTAHCAELAGALPRTQNARGIGRREWKRLLTAVTVVSVLGFLVCEALVMLGRDMDRWWTPYAFGDLALFVGVTLLVWQLLGQKGLARSLQAGMLTTGSLYVAFLLVTAGLIVANEQAIQLPVGVGAVYRYDPRTEVPDADIVAARPESDIVAHLENKRVFPAASCRISRERDGALRFISGSHADVGKVALHPVSSFEVESVLIRRVPNERWWDDDPTFVARVHLRAEFADLGRQDMDIELTAGPGPRGDLLGLLSQGYVAPEFNDWMPRSVYVGQG